jgi:hypothetical protein
VQFIVSLLVGFPVWTRIRRVEIALHAEDDERRGKAGAALLPSPPLNTRCPVNLVSDGNAGRIDGPCKPFIKVAFTFC